MSARQERKLWGKARPAKSTDLDVANDRKMLVWVCVNSQTGQAASRSTVAPCDRNIGPTRSGSAQLFRARRPSSKTRDLPCRVTLLATFYRAWLVRDCPVVRQDRNVSTGMARRAKDLHCKTIPFGLLLPIALVILSHEFDQV